jgi:cell division septation protein DedD
MKALLARALVCAFPCLAMAQVAVLQIKVIEGEGAVHPAGVRVSKPLTVQVTDEHGRPVAGATVSFQLPPEGPGGLFPNGLRTDLAITDAAGRATLHAVILNNTEGQFRIRITAVKDQARAGLVCYQYIGENQAAPAAEQPAPAIEKPAPAAPAPPASKPAAAAKERSPGVTPTTVKMSHGVSKKWIILGALAAGGAAAFLGASRRGSSKTVSASTVSIGSPTITVGHP